MELNPLHFTVDYWRDRYDEVLKKIGKLDRLQLVTYDKHYLTAIGKDQIRNVKQHKAGLEPTMRLVLVLEKLADDLKMDKDIKNKYIKSQKLQAS
ncbi:MAG: hypothetical protein Q8K92_19800 [Leadbetterella sp.]|nr:hypothetical protein [Leadbetterella sp.]